MLGEFLRARQPAWDFRNHDCSRWLDAWLRLNDHPSPMQAIGIEYDSERSAKLVIGRGGGLLALWTRGMEAIGLHEITKPRPGAGAILSLPTDDATNQTCGIWTGERWASVHRHGTLFGEGSPLKMWGV